MKIVPKLQEGYIIQQDKIEDTRPIIQERVKLVPKPTPSALLYDKDKIDFYKDLQDYYNYNVFGYGLQGSLTRYNPATQLDLIRSNFEYAGNNALNFGVDIAGSILPLVALGKAGLVYTRIARSPLLKFSSKGNLGPLSKYTKSGIIGLGAEAIVIEDSPVTVGKLSVIPKEEMAVRNSIPNVVPSEYVGLVLGENLSTYVLRKVRILNKETFQKYLAKLDEIMKKHNFRIVKDPLVLYRAYTDGNIVIDDIAPGNVGLNLFGKPRIIDFNLLTVPEWIELGFVLN